MLNYLKKIAIFVFDLIDKFIHQRNILKSIKKEKLMINTFIDIGAHKGKYTDLFIHNYNIKNVYMFEPQLTMFKHIKKKYKNVKIINIFNCGISNKNEKKIFNINKHDLTSSIKKLNPKNTYLNLKSKLFSTNLKGMVERKTIIKTIKLKDFFLRKNIKNVDLIKVDTEGHELEVLLGLKKKIILVKAFLIEFHDNQTYLNYDNKKIEKILKKNNFKLKKRVKFPFTTWEDRLYIRKD
jgi:FkbM family methyltransferase